MATTKTKGYEPVYDEKGKRIKKVYKRGEDYVYRARRPDSGRDWWITIPESALLHGDDESDRQLLPHIAKDMGRMLTEIDFDDEMWWLGANAVAEMRPELEELFFQVLAICDVIERLKNDEEPSVPWSPEMADEVREGADDCHLKLYELQLKLSNRLDLLVHSHVGTEYSSWIPIFKARSYSG